jgi:pectate lyase-like protein
VVIGLAFAGLLVFGDILTTYAACSNPSPLPSGYAAPCPVFSVSPAAVTQSGFLGLTATPVAGATDYIYTTAYYAKGSTWLPVTLTGNNAAPSYSTALATGSLTASILSTLTPGTNYVVLWDWLWDAQAQCYKGPGLNQCNTGTWRLQTFGLTAVGSSPTYTLTVNIQGNGTVASNSGRLNCSSTCSVVFDGGTPITLTATSGAGASFTSWSGCPAPSGTTCVLALSADLTVTATFSGASFTYSQSAYSSGCTTGCNSYYVSPSGSDSNAGTQSSPWKTLNHANSAIVLGSNGTVVHVAPGTYVKRVDLPHISVSCATPSGVVRSRGLARTPCGRS